MPLGGDVGELFGEVLRSLFSTIGSYIIGLTVVGLILIGRATFSFIDWAQRASSATARVARRARRRRPPRPRRRLERGARDRPASATSKPAAPTSRRSPSRPASADAIIAALADDDGRRHESARAAAPLALDVRRARARRRRRRRRVTPTADRAATKTRGPEAGDRRGDREREPRRAPDAAPRCATPSPIPPVDVAEAPPPPTRSARRSSSSPRSSTPAPRSTHREGRDRQGRRPRSAKAFACRRPTSSSRHRGAASRSTRSSSRRRPQLLEKTLSDYGVSGKVEEIHPGPDRHDVRGLARGRHQGLEGRGPRRRSRARPLAQGPHHRADPGQEPDRLRDPERAPHRR